MPTPSRLIACTAGFVFLLAAPAATQTPEHNTMDVGVGYSYLWRPGEDAPGGWNVAFAREITPVMRWVADFSGQYGADNSVHTFQGGLRFGLSRTEAVVPFTVLLAGAGYGESALEGGESELAFTMQLTAGVDFMFEPDGLGIRAQFEFPAFFVEDGPEVRGRMTVAVVIPFK